MDTPPPFPDRQPPATRTGLIVRGWLMLILGLFLAVAMVAVTLHLVPIINEAPRSGSSPRYHGTHDMTVKMFTLFGAIFLFGLTMVGNGAWILSYGRQNRFLQTLGVLLGIGVFAGGMYIAATFK